MTSLYSCTHGGLTFTLPALFSMDIPALRLSSNSWCVTLHHLAAPPPLPSRWQGAEGLSGSNFLSAAHLITAGTQVGRGGGGIPVIFYTLGWQPQISFLCCKTLSDKNTNNSLLHHTSCFAGGLMSWNEKGIKQEVEFSLCGSILASYASGSVPPSLKVPKRPHSLTVLWTFWHFLA